MNTIEGKITNWAFGGSGILRHEGLALFVPFTCPGDIICCCIEHRKKNCAHANLIQIIDPSPKRTLPQCKVYGTCGGCQLQHVQYKEQLHYKTQSVQDALQRIGGVKDCIVHPTRPANTTWNYRRHITLHIKEGKLGYIALDNQNIVSAQDCRLSNCTKVIPLLEELVSKLGTVSGKVAIIETKDGFLFDWNLPKLALPMLKQYHAENPSWLGGVLRPDIAIGQTTGYLNVLNHTFSFKIGAFLQNHSEQSENIYRDIINYVDKTASKRILDLYCGIGITTTLFAEKSISVTGIESNPQAVKAAKQNISSFPHAAILCGSAESLIPKQKGHFDLVFINPPRTGLHSKVVQTLHSMKPQHLLYLSCMPATLARDIKLLIRDYEIVSCQPYDMFPQTSHVETLIILKRRNQSLTS